MSHLFVTVEFRDQLADTTRPLDSLEQGRRIVDNEVEWENTVQAYVWNVTNGNRVLYCQHGKFNYAHNDELNIDTLVEGY